MKTISVFFILAIAVISCGPSLRETGIPTEGTVIGKRKTSTGSKLKYYITVNFFTQPDKENPKPEPPKDTAPKTADEIIEGLTLDFNMGEYQTAEITVTSVEYDKYMDGDVVKIKYDKNDPAIAILDE
jgi:hypothetical protein